MSGRHEVLADVERSPVVDAYAPVERSRQPLLRDHEIRFGEEFLDAAAQVIERFDLAHSEREAAVGLLENAGQTEHRHDLVDVVAVDHQRLGHRNSVTRQELVEVYLVGALENRIRIVEEASGAV